MNAVASPAASVLLLRDTPQGPQVLLARRPPGMRAFADNWVFPGGRTESCDQQSIVDTLTVARRTALRETFEETGALLFTLPQRSGRQHCAATLRSAPPAEFFVVAQRLGLHLDASTLPSWSHWVAPLQLRRRFDTQFFLARLDEQDVLCADGGETLELAWWQPAAAVAAVQEHSLRCAPPTLMNLLELDQLTRGSPSTSAVLAEAQRRQHISITPRVLVDGAAQWVVYPWDPQFGMLPPGGAPAQIPARYFELPSRMPLQGS